MNGTASSGTPCGTSGAATTVCCPTCGPDWTGSPDLYTLHRRGPNASINLITVHDGFTLTDLVSYNDKHNEANTENNRDGTGDNRSWNCGVEGPTDEPGVLPNCAPRQRRALLLILVLARGVPLLLGGDEVLRRTQRGNNNAYCQDNDIAWWDWSSPGRRIARLHREPDRAPASAPGPAAQALPDRSGRDPLVHPFRFRR